MVRFYSWPEQGEPETECSGGLATLAWFQDMLVPKGIQYGEWEVQAAGDTQSQVGGDICMKRRMPSSSWDCKDKFQPEKRLSRVS